MRIRHTRAGFSLLELTIAIVLLTVFLGTAGLAVRQGYDAYRNTSSVADLQTRLRRAMDGTAGELVATGREVLFPDPVGDYGSETLSFRNAVGLAGTGPLWGDLNRIGFEYEAGDPDDGVDNDGDGLVDEGLLVLTRDVGGPNEMRVVLCSGVAEMGAGETIDDDDENGNGVKDEMGFNVQRVDDVLVLRLTLEARDAGGREQLRSVQTSIRLRN